MRGVHSNYKRSRQFISWGAQNGIPYDHRLKIKPGVENTSSFKENSGPDYDDMCAYKIG